ncbi:MAG TPA: hypothetical protein VF521_06645, partial [Pyrinomonadaceae bacterium]
FLRPTDTAQAFVPNRPAEFVLGVGLNNRTHESITRTAITTIDKDMFHVAQITGSMDFAITEIANSNVSVDTPKQLGGTQFSASASHFDGENFAGSMRRLRDYKNNVISRMAARDVGQARYYLGQALHTLQDFYSHSNWIERGGTSPWAALGVSVLPNPSPNVQTCNNCARNNCTDCDALLPGAPLTTGYFDSDDRRKPNEFKCSHGGVNRLDADTSGAGSLHNGINKDTRDCRDSPHSNLHEAAARVATQATVDYVKSITNAIGPAKSKLLLGAGTTLAFAVDTTGSMDDEIEAIQDKLLEMVDVRMGTPLEPTLFVLSAFNDPGGPPNSANSANGTLLNTSDVNEFKNAVMALTADGGGDCPELPYFGMGDAMRYIRDCNLYVFTDAGARESVFDREVVTEEMVRGKVHPQIFFTGSSYFDCPIDEDYYVTAEKTGGTVYEISPEEIYDISALPGLLDLVNGVDLGYYRGYFNGFWQTYYIPVDTFLSRTTIIINGAPSANLIIHRPDGTQVAATDPNVTFIPYGTGTIFSFVNPAPGLWSVSVNGTPPAPLSAPLAARSSATREGEVTSTKGQAQSQGNAPRASKSTEPRASMATSGGGGPAAQLAGDPGAFTIQVKGESDMHSARFDFAEVGGVSGHVGMFPIQSSPLVGATQNVMASIAATGASNVQFEFRNTDGSLLQTLNMTEIPPLPADPDIDPVADVQRVFVGEVTVPSVPFQVFVTGVDTNGVTYQRMVPGLIRPQTLEVTPPAFEDMSPGQARTYKVKVRNAGPADTFRLGASDDLHYVSAPVPASITLATNETREVTLKLQVPVDAPLDDVDTVTVTANSETTPGVGNTVSRPPFRIVAPPVLKLDSLTATPSGGDGDAFIEPGEGGTIDARLLNVGADAAAGITATLSSSTPGVTVTSAESLYADLAPGDGASPATPFTFTVAPAASCGQTMEFTLRVDYDAGTAPIFHHFFIPTGHGSDEHVFS